MKTRTTAITLAALMALNVQPVLAAKHTGYTKIVAPANSDARFSVPFTKKAERASGVNEFTVDTVTGNGVSILNNLFVDNAYNGTHYVRFVSGNASGLWSTITDNGLNTVDLANLNVKDKVQVGDTFRIYKHHTLGSIFPSTLEGKSHVNGTRVLFYDNNIGAMSQNKSASKTAVYNSASNVWQGSGISNNTILEPETQLILRNLSGSPLTLVTAGRVADYNPALLIASSGDLNIGTGLPVNVKLRNAGLQGTNARRVLFFDNAAIGQNKSAVKTGVWNAGSSIWQGFVGAPDEPLKAGEAFTYRLPAGETFAAKVTINNPLK